MIVYSEVANRLQIKRTSEPTLNAIPNAGHRRTIKYWPQGAPDSKRGTSDNREANMIHCTDPSGRHNERAGDEVSEPNTRITYGILESKSGVNRSVPYPGLPPRESSRNHGRRNHPCVLTVNELCTTLDQNSHTHDIERIGDPESDKVPCSPLSAFRLDCMPTSAQ